MEGIIIMRGVDLSIIIVSYNTSGLLIDCIDSIIENSGDLNYEIIVVDNASHDGTIPRIKEKMKDIRQLKLIENKKNEGFSKANNKGVKISKGRYVLFLNPDTLVFEQTLKGMVEFMDRKNEAGAATCYVQMPNGKLDDAAHRGFPTPWRAFCHFSYLAKVIPPNKMVSGYNLSYLDLTKAHEIDACAGAFMVVRRGSGDEVGWWDEDYFWYGEDIDFCYRLKENKWKIYFVPDFRILHYKGVSGGIKKESKSITTATKETRNKAIEARFKAMEIFYGKHYKNKYPGFLSSLVLLGIRGKYYFSKLTNTL
jgi:GT2 family glycosyltransferase